MSNGRLPAVIDRSTDPVVERFLDLVATTGNTTAAAKAVGTHRNSWYERSQRDPAFRARWDQAQLMSRRNQAAEVMEKAMILSGRIVDEPVLDPVTGDPMLDDDLEPIVIRKVLDYDARIVSKLLDKLVHSEDQPITAVQINNLMPEQQAPPAPPRVARLVYASDDPAAVLQPSVTEAIQDATWEPVQ